MCILSLIHSFMDVLNAYLFLSIHSWLVGAVDLIPCLIPAMEAKHETSIVPP
jgi:predicted ferric reductase